MTECPVATAWSEALSPALFPPDSPRVAVALPRQALSPSFASTMQFGVNRGPVPPDLATTFQMDPDEIAEVAFFSARESAAALAVARSPGRRACSLWIAASLAAIVAGILVGSGLSSGTDQTAQAVAAIEVMPSPSPSVIVVPPAPGPELAPLTVARPRLHRAHARAAIKPAEPKRDEVKVADVIFGGRE
jgi:hypothetical protein